MILYVVVKGREQMAIIFAMYLLAVQAVSLVILSLL